MPVTLDTSHSAMEQTPRGISFSLRQLSRVNLIGSTALDCGENPFVTGEGIEEQCEKEIE